MRRLVLLALIPGLLAAEDHWVKFASGPFEAWTDAGQRAAREDMVRLEEFRHALGEILGEPDLQARLPIRIFVFKNAKGWTTAPLTETRDGLAIVLDEKATPGPTLYTQLTRLFLDANTGRMPAAFEHGLIEYFSTIEVTGIRITAGAPPRPAPDLDWARIHLLVGDLEYLGKLRVLLFNLRKGVDQEPAFRNAFGKSPAEIEAQAKQHLAAGNFQTTTLSSRPLSERDFVERQVSDSDARLARADLLAGSQSAAEYQALLRDQVKVAEAEEGLGILALRDKHADEAKRHFAASMAAGSTSARCYMEYAKLEPDNQKATEALLHAAGINSKLDEPFALLAARDTDPAKRLAHWKAAAERDPRNAAYWKALAEAYVAQHNYAEAAKAWDQGAQAAIDPAERDRMRQARLEIEEQRLDYEAAERKREADEKAREIENLKTEARAEVHALEQKYKSDTPNANQKVVPWWDGPKPAGKVTGLLKQVDCLGSQARMVIESGDHKTVRLLIPDPTKLVVTGADQALGCGAQKPRQVSVEYFPKTNTRLATAGEAATIEFQ